MIVQNSFPEARMRVSRLSMGPPVPYPVSSRLIGPDIAELRRLVLPMREIMEAEPTAQSFKTEMGERAPALRLRFDQIGRAHVELQSLMRNSYAVFCLKKKKKEYQRNKTIEDISHKY